VFVDDRPLHPNVMLPSNTRAYSSGSPFLLALSWKDQLWTNTSLFDLFVSYKDNKSFKTLSPDQEFETKGLALALPVSV
jgi:hypothetical protein